MSVEIKAKAPKVDKEAAIMVDLGDNAQDAIDRFGAEVVFSNYLANVKIGVQSGIRRYLEAGLGQDEIQAKFENYKPGVTMDRVVDPVAALANKMKSMTPEEQAALFAQLREKLEAAQG
jgi:hypothetical protein